MTSLPITSRIDSVRSYDLEPATVPVETLVGALVAAYALVAHADGEVAGAERRRLFSLIRDTPALSGVSREQVAEEAAMHEANFRLDPEVAQQIAREWLSPIAGHRRAAHLIVAACREIIPADGVAHPGEYRALAEIKALLGLDEQIPGTRSTEKPATRPTA